MARSAEVHEDPVVRNPSSAAAAIERSGIREIMDLAARRPDAIQPEVGNLQEGLACLVRAVEAWAPRAARAGDAIGPAVGAIGSGAA